MVINPVPPKGVFFDTHLFIILRVYELESTPQA